MFKLTLYVDEKSVNRLQQLISDIEGCLETTPDTEITLNLSQKTKTRINELAPNKGYYAFPPDFSYSVLSFLAFTQTFFAAKVRETGYGNSKFVSVYWEALSLKDKFRGGYSK